MKSIKARRTHALLAAAALYGGALAFAVPATSAQAQTPWPGGTWTPEAASYGTAQDLQQNVTMDDGVILKADISYPTNPATGARATGPFPVLFTLTPYLGTSAKQGDYFVQRGYIFITGYIRGTNASGGNFGFFSERDAKDGAELVQWAATKVQNSNGTVGLWGGSYGGLDQIYTLAALGPGSAVKAMTPSCFGAEFYRETYFDGGIPTATEQFPLHFQQLMGGTTTAAYGNAMYADIAAGGEKAYDLNFWQTRTPGNYVKQMVDADVPMLIWSSNLDIYARSSLEFYTYMQNAYARGNTHHDDADDGSRSEHIEAIYGPMQRNKPVTPRVQIIISQGGHCAGEDQAIQLEWFDTWLKGIKTGMDQTQRPIHVHEVISNNWFNTTYYPVVPTYTQYFLNLYGQLSTADKKDNTQDTIAWGQPAANTTVQYDGPVLPTGGTLAGPISASVFASSTTANLELIATVQLVKADGTVTSLSHGAVLSSLSANVEDRLWSDDNGTPVRPYGAYNHDSFVTAGKVEKYDWAMQPIFAQIPPGGKLRLVFTTQTPTSQCQSILGTDACYPTTPQNATLGGGMFTIYHQTKQGSSSINLPLLPANCWQTTATASDPYWANDSIVHGSNAPCQLGKTAQNP